METITLKKEKTIALVALIFAIVSLISSGIFYNNNKTLKNNLHAEKISAENMLSEKLALQKEIELFKNQMNALKGKNQELNNLIASSNKKLIEKEATLNKIVRQNGNGNSKQLKKQIAELQQLKKDFELSVMALNGNIKKLTNDNENLNKTIALLQEENKQLASNLAILSSITADNYQAETTKKKDKLTVVAKRTKKMSVSFKVPENMVEHISFQVSKPDGSVVKGKENGIAYQVVTEEGSDLFASVLTDEIKVSKKIEMTYSPKEKLKSGVYKVALFNGDKYIGSCNIKLR
ncbi:MAG: hypothetical protein CVT95_08470 [Bacteroidetes bacterium HGW-Bacteroidetes-12]|nr:MAG: hypothetical protein CVT95_08470 [Bacteroidetes bacterium HGW-Bacteroidetes-12]